MLMRTCAWNGDTVCVLKAGVSGRTFGRSGALNKAGLRRRKSHMRATTARRNARGHRGAQRNTFAQTRHKVRQGVGADLSAKPTLNRLMPRATLGRSPTGPGPPTTRRRVAAGNGLRGGERHFDGTHINHPPVSDLPTPAQKSDKVKRRSSAGKNIRQRECQTGHQAARIGEHVPSGRAQKAGEQTGGLQVPVCRAHTTIRLSGETHGRKGPVRAPSMTHVYVYAHTHTRACTRSETDTSACEQADARNAAQHNSCAMDRSVRLRSHCPCRCRTPPGPGAALSEYNLVAREFASDCRACRWTTWAPLPTPHRAICHALTTPNPRDLTCGRRKRCKHICEHVFPELYNCLEHQPSAEEDKKNRHE